MGTGIANNSHPSDWTVERSKTAPAGVLSRRFRGRILNRQTAASLRCPGHFDETPKTISAMVFEQPTAADLTGPAEAFQRRFRPAVDVAALRCSGRFVSCPSSFSTELPWIRHWSRLWPAERAQKLPDWVCFSHGLGSSPPLFTTLLCRRGSRCWRGSELWRSGWWHGSKLWRSGRQFQGRGCSDRWRSYSCRPSLASWLVCETLANSRDNCDSHRNHSHRNCPACQALRLPMLGVAMP
jgi:hypothetical protein